jgi:hypothetical protein
MKKNVLLAALLIIAMSGFGQNATNETLEKIITKVADTVAGQSGQWQFAIKDRLFICVTDENHNRMRIISPVTEIQNLPEGELENALVANFHSALDVKYAISEGVLWTVFIHPLKELSEAQIEDAILQVYNGAETFGTTYSSTNLVFPGRIPSEADQKNPVEIPKLRKG